MGRSGWIPTPRHPALDVPERVATLVRMASSLPDELVSQLVDPETHEPVDRATDRELQSLREALARGRARRHDGGAPPDEFEAAFLTEGGDRAYLVVDGIPNFLVNERIDLDPPLERE